MTRRLSSLFMVLIKQLLCCLQSHILDFSSHQELIYNSMIHVSVCLVDLLNMLFKDLLFNEISVVAACSSGGIATTTKGWRLTITFIIESRLV